MINFLLYILALFLAPFVAGFLNFIFLIVFARVIDLLKRKNKEKILNIVLSIESFCAAFLTIIFLDRLLNTFKLNINWFFVIALIVLFLINGITRIRKTTNQDRLFEIYETIADIVGILLGFLIILI
ncbi:hypothetical protein M0R19_07870 [Candidatus Pacearchaeota archaeon]|nr:hypothetical protein [Candidatus Pacearchaeota archaeon]